MLKHISVVTFFLLLVFSLVPSLKAAGLSTTFSEVVIEELEAGQTYSVNETAGLPLIVVNTGKQPMDLKMELLLPQKKELKKGYQPIPDLSWIKLKKYEFKGVKPGGSAVTDVLISIPADKKYQGRQYQVYIWSHSVGGFIGVGLKSRLLFKIKNN